MGMALQGLFFVEILGDNKLADLDMGAVAYYISPAAAAMAGEDSPLLDQYLRGVDRETILRVGNPLQVELTVCDDLIEGLQERGFRLGHPWSFRYHPVSLPIPEVAIRFQPPSSDILTGGPFPQGASLPAAAMPFGISNCKSQISNSEI
jgi:hypothetical protein